MIEISETELRQLLEKVYSYGFDFGAKNERASLHDHENYTEKCKADIDKLTTKFRQGESDDTI